MKHFKAQKTLVFLIAAIAQEMQADELHTLVAIEESNLDLPPTGLISAEIQRYFKGEGETTLKVQEVDLEGVVIDEFELTPPESQFEEDEEPATVYDELLMLSRLSKIKRAIGDHNYRDVNKKAVLLLAEHHSGYSDDENSVSMGGPLADYVTPKKKDELWNEYLAKRVVSNDCHMDACGSQDDE